jgi:CubicO group peptidase (beta-lactamase class C family)
MLDLMPRAAAALTRPARHSAADLLGAVLADGDTVAARAVLRLGLDVRALVTAAGQAGRGPAQAGRGGLEWDRDWWVSQAEDEALRRGHGYVGTEHLLLGLLHAGPVAAALAGLGSSARAVRGQVWRTLSDDAPGGEWRPDGPGRAMGDPSAPGHPVLAAIAAQEPVVGMSWAASGEGRAVRTAAYGWADPLRGVPVAADTRFRVGSVTKIATALLMLRLRDHGIVDLDEPAAARLCSVRLLDCDGAPSTATVRQLLTHTSGLPRGSGLRHYGGPVPAVGELFAEGIRADRPAGQWSYSNLGFVALGALAADVLGAPFGECLRDWVLGPLGLAESASLQQLPQPPHGGQPAGSPVARGHAFDAGQIFPVRPSSVLALGAGELVASARDAAVLAAATVSGQLLPAESASEMLMPYVQCGPDAWQGLGVRIEHHGPVRLAGHAGSFPGFDAAAFACPETGESAALLANTNTGLLTGQLRTALLPGTWQRYGP